MKFLSQHLPSTDFSGSVESSFKKEGFTLGSVSHRSLCTGSLPVFSEAELSWGPQYCWRPSPRGSGCRCGQPAPAGAGALEPQGSAAAAS